MKKKTAIGLVLVIVIAILGYNYLYQDHRDVASSDVSASFTSSELIDVFTDSDLTNDIEALDKVIEIKGRVTHIDESNVTLDSQIFVEMNSTVDLKENQLITIKGRCLGYDDLMEEVKIDQALLKN